MTDLSAFENHPSLRVSPALPDLVDGGLSDAQRTVKRMAQDYFEITLPVVAYGRFALMIAAWTPSAQDDLELGPRDCHSGRGGLQVHDAVRARVGLHNRYLALLPAGAEIESELSSGS